MVNSRWLWLNRYCYAFKCMCVFIVRISRVRTHLFQTLYQAKRVQSWLLMVIWYWRNGMNFHENAANFWNSENCYFWFCRWNSYEPDKCVIALQGLEKKVTRLAWSVLQLIEYWFFFCSFTAIQKFYTLLDVSAFHCRKNVEVVDFIFLRHTKVAHSIALYLVYFPLFHF